jgi:hypothetical protein
MRLFCLLVAALALAGCGGQSEADKANEEARKAQAERFTAATREAMATYLREHSNLYPETYSKIECVNVSYFSLACFAYLDGGQECDVFYVGRSENQDRVEVRPGDRKVPCGQPQARLGGQSVNPTAAPLARSS